MCEGHAHLPSSAVAGDGLRAVIAGKGGVGKSTVTALMARQLARRGCPVLAVDADEQRNLAATLGFAPDAAAALVPVADQAEYIEEKTGAMGLVCLNPDTSDVVERLAATGPDGVRLLAMGSVRQAAGGCLCPENSLLSATISGMRLRRGEVILMDTHAGVEHFGRALARGFDQAFVVVDPTYNALQVGLDAARLSRELGIDGIHLVINRTRGEADESRVLDKIGSFGFSSVHSLPYDERALDCEPSVETLLAGSPLAEAVDHIAGHVLEGVLCAA